MCHEVLHYSLLDQLVFLLLSKRQAGGRNLLGCDQPIVRIEGSLFKQCEIQCTVESYNVLWANTRMESINSHM